MNVQKAPSWNFVKCLTNLVQYKTLKNICRGVRSCHILVANQKNEKNSKPLFSSFYWLITLKLKIFCIIHYLWIPKHYIFGCIGNSKSFLHIGNLKIAEIESCETAVKEWFDPFVLHYSCFIFLHRNMSCLNKSSSLFRRLL